MSVLMPMMHQGGGVDGGEVYDDDDSNAAKTPMDLAKQNDLTVEPLSPEMQELAHIVATTCLYERMHSQVT